MLLIDEGLGSGADRLTFSRVFRRLAASRGIRVTNASVLGRIWEDTEAYRSEVLASVASDLNEEEFAVAVDAAVGVFAKADLSSIEGRTAAVRELCRVAGEANVVALASSRTWHLFVAIWGLAASGSTAVAHTPVTDQAAATYDEVTGRLEAILEGFMVALGLRLREGYELRQLALAVVSLAEGCALRDRIDPVSTRGIKLPSGPDGAVQEWTLFAVGFEALVWQFTEWDPDVQPPRGPTNP